MHPEVVVGPTAWQWDGLARYAQLGAVLALAGVGISAATGALPLLVLFAALMVGLFVASLVLVVLSDRTARAERALGYSTIFDAAGFDLRDARTLDLVRSRDTPPTDESRVPRSLVLGMLRTGLERLPKPKDD